MTVYGEQSPIRVVELNDPALSALKFIRPIRRLMSAEDAWNLLHQTASPAHITELALEYGPAWGAPEVFCRAAARVYASMLPVALGLHVLAGPFDTARVYGADTMMLPDYPVVRADIENSRYGRPVPPNTLRELWDPSPRELARLIRMEKLRRRAVRVQYDEQKVKQELEQHYSQAIYVKTPGCWDPFLMMVVGIHEYLHIYLEHTTHLIPATLNYLDPRDHRIAHELLNSAFDGHIHTLFGVHPYARRMLQLIDFPPRVGDQRVAVLDDSNEPTDPLDQLHDASERPDQNQESQPPEIRVVQQGESRTQYTAIYYRRRVANVIREETERNREIGDAAALSELLLQWEQQERRDLFRESMFRFRQALIETFMSAIYEESRAPDPTDRYLIRKGKIDRKLAARDEEYNTIRLLVGIDSSGSMSDDEIVDCIETMRVALGGQAVIDAFFCDTAPMPIAFDIQAQELPNAVRRMERIPRGGTSLGELIRQYEPVFQRDFAQLAGVVLLTDGYNHDWAEDTLRAHQLPLVIAYLEQGGYRPEVDYEHVTTVPIEKSK